MLFSFGKDCQPQGMSAKQAHLKVWNQILQYYFLRATGSKRGGEKSLLQSDYLTLWLKGLLLTNSKLSEFHKYPNKRLLARHDWRWYVPI